MIYIGKILVDRLPFDYGASLKKKKVEPFHTGLSHTAMMDLCFKKLVLARRSNHAISDL